MKRIKITKQKIIRYVVMLIALSVFSYSAYQLTLIYLDSKASKDVYSEISDMFMKQPESNGETQTNSEGEPVTLNNSSMGAVFVWDYDLMLSYNNEAKGYIRQKNGEYIDNPIMQHADNEYYLDHLPDNSYNKSGSIFIDYRIEEGLEAKNCIVYGHRMGSRTDFNIFGSLIWYISKSGYAKDNPDMDIYIGYDHYKYYVFAAYETSSLGSDTYQYQFSDDEAFLDYIAKCREKSTYDFPSAGEITAEDTIITLSTCTINDENKRSIVQLVRREKIDDSVKASDSE